MFEDNYSTVVSILRRAPQAFIHGWPKVELSLNPCAPVPEGASVDKFEFRRMMLKGGDVAVLGRNMAENDGARMCDWVRVA